MTDLLAGYVTVAEAAALLRVSPSTIWRWIDRGDLPASRIGRRRVRVKRADLERVVTPARGKPEMSEEQVRQAMAALEGMRKFRAEQLEKRGGVPYPDSAEMIREMREERARQIDGLH